MYPGSLCQPRTARPQTTRRRWVERERESEKGWDGNHCGPQQHLLKTGMSAEHF